MAKKEEKKLEISYATKKEMEKQSCGGISLCEDERGEYFTKTEYVGSKLLDPYRHYRKGQAELEGKVMQLVDWHLAKDTPEVEDVEEAEKEVQG